MFPSQVTSSIAAARGTAQLWGKVPRAEGNPLGIEDFPGLNPSLEDGEGRFPVYLAAICSSLAFALLEMSLLSWENSALLRRSPGQWC